MYETLMPLLSLALDHTITLIGAAILIIARPLVVRAADWLQLRADSEVRAYLMQGLDRAVEYGRAEARRRLGTVTTEVAIERGAALRVDLARDYVQKRFPDALDRFHIDAPALEAMIRARLPAPPIGTAH